MKAQIIGLFLVLAVMFTAVNVSEMSAQKKTKPVKGQVISFNDYVQGGTGIITKEQAKDLAEKGNPIVLKSGKTIYFVYNADGSFASKKLANYADNKTVGVVGKTKKSKGFNYIIADIIEGM